MRDHRRAMMSARPWEIGDHLSTDLDEHSIGTAEAHNPLLFAGISVRELVTGPPKWLQMPLLKRWINLAVRPGTDIYSDRDPFEDTFDITFERDGREIVIKTALTEIEDAGENEIICNIYGTVFDRGEAPFWFVEHIG